MILIPGSPQSCGDRPGLLGSARKMCACLQGCDLTIITEMQWGGSYAWSVRMKEYRFFRKDKWGSQGGGATLCVSEQLECTVLCLGVDEELTRILWVRTKGRAGTGDIKVGVCNSHLTRKAEWLMPSIGSEEQPHDHKPWSSWVNSTTPISVGGTTQQGISSLGGSWMHWW